MQGGEGEDDDEDGSLGDEDAAMQKRKRPAPRAEVVEEEGLDVKRQRQQQRDSLDDTELLAPTVPAPRQAPRAPMQLKMHKS